MISKEDLKKIVILKSLTDDMLEKLIPIANTSSFNKGEIIFKEGDLADKFYILKRGKVLLEKRISDKITVSVDSIKPGYLFGWSAILDEGSYTTDAVCAEECEAFNFSRENILDLIDKDHSLGYKLTKQILGVIKTRLDYRTDQFIKVITNHPHMQTLFEK
jgi:CRP-like cAMP-binding protein